MNSDSVNVPECLLKCRSVICNRKYDEKNFLYCVIQHLWPEMANIRHCEKIPKEYEKKFNLRGLTFPLQFSQISKFVRINKHLLLRIRVLFEGEYQLSVLDIFSNRSGEKNKNKNTLNLLIVKSDCRISSADKDSIDVNGISGLKDLEHQHHLFTIANLNGFLNNRKSIRQRQSGRSQFCVELNKHRACGYSICFVDSENEVFYQETYSGKDAVENFLSKLDYFEELVQARKQRFKNTSQIIANENDWEEYHAATHCHICKKEFDQTSRKYKKVVDHDHVTGNIVLAAHSICNLQRQGPLRTPLYFHNAKG